MRTSVPINMRVNQERLTLIDWAAREEGVTRTDFLLRAAIQEATRVRSDRSPSRPEYLPMPDRRGSAVMTYREALAAAMAELTADPRAIFLGQSIVAGGTAMTVTLRDVPPSQLIELPVFEDTQMGLSTGLALAGYLPVSIYPRINFLLLATSQLVLHLDALSLYSDYRPRVIIRTAIPTLIPLDPGPQHIDPSYDDPKWLVDGITVDRVGNTLPYLEPNGYVAALRAMLRTVYVHELTAAAEILPAYRAALVRPLSTIIVEHAELYDSE